jgi:hypothetical protein
VFTYAYYTNIYNSLLTLPLHSFAIFRLRSPSSEPLHSTTCPARVFHFHIALPFRLHYDDQFNKFLGDLPYSVCAIRSYYLYAACSSYFFTDEIIYISSHTVPLFFSSHEDFLLNNSSRLLLFHSTVFHTLTTFHLHIAEYFQLCCEIYFCNFLRYVYILQISPKCFCTFHDGQSLLNICYVLYR